MKIKCLQLIVLLFVFPLFSIKAEELSQAILDFSSTNTSDAISQRLVDILYRNHRREIFYPFESEADTSWDWGAHSLFSNGHNARYDFSNLGFQLLGARKFSKLLSIETLTGFHLLKNDSTGESRFIFSGGVKGYWILSEAYSSSLEIHQDLLGGGTMIQAGGISEQYTALSIKPSFNARWSERWRSQLRVQHYSISDSNKKLLMDFSTLFGISTGTPWIWIGVGIEKLSYSYISPNYWSPSEFFSYGARLEATIPILDKLSLACGLNANRLHDKDSNASGTGYYFSGRLQYGDRNTFNVSTYLNKIESVQNNSRWHSTQVGLNASVPF